MTHGRCTQRQRPALTEGQRINMRYLLTIILCLWLSPALAFSGFLGASTGGAPVATCDTQSDTCSGTAGTVYYIGRYNAAVAYAGKIVADNGNKKCKLTLELFKTGSPTNNFSVEIWTDDGGSPSLPSSLISGQTYTIDPATITETTAAGAQTNPVLVNIDWTPTSGNTYRLVVRHTGTYDDPYDWGANYLSFPRIDNCTPDNSISQQNTSGTWSNVSDYYNIGYKFYE